MTSKKAIITKENLSNEVVKAAISNPNGILMSNDPEVRKAVASEIDNLLTKLHEQRKAA